MSRAPLTQDEITALKEIARWWNAGKLFGILATGIDAAGYGVVHFVDCLKVHWK